MRLDDATGELRSGAISIRDQVLAVWSRRKWIGIVVFLIVAAAVTTIARGLPDVYRATATVLVERQHVSETFVRSSVTSELETRIQIISQEVLSRARLGDLIAQLDLAPGGRGQPVTEGAIQRMRRNILLELKAAPSTTGRSATVAFNLSYQGRDPETVARVANALASFYVEENVRLRERQAVGTAAFLRLQVADARTRLDAQEQRLAEFRARHAGELPQQTASTIATLERLHAQLDLNSANQLRAMDRRTALARELGEGAAAGGTAGETTAANLAKAQHELAELRRQYTDKHPDVIGLRAAIAALRRELADKTAESAEATPTASSAPPRASAPALRKADAELEFLKTQEAKLQRQIAAYQRRLETAPEREQELQQRTAEYDRAKEFYSSLLRRYEDAHLAESMEQSERGERFRVLDHALAPKQPVAPNRLQVIVLGLVLGAGLGAGAMLAAEFLGRSLHTVADLRALTTAPVLVSIPRIVTDADRRRARWRYSLAMLGVAVVLVVVVRTSQYIASDNEALLAMVARDSVRLVK